MSAKILYLLFETREVNNINYLMILNIYTEKKIWKKIGNQERYYSGYFDGEDICIILDDSTCMLDPATAPFKYSEKELREKLLSFDTEKMLCELPELCPGITFDYGCDNGEVLHLLFHRKFFENGKKTINYVTAAFEEKTLQMFYRVGDYVGYYDRSENIFVKDQTSSDKLIPLQNFPYFTCDIPQLLGKLKEIKRTIFGVKVFEIAIQGNNCEFLWQGGKEKEATSDFQSWCDFAPSQRYRFATEVWTEHRDDCNLIDELKTLSDEARQMQDRDRYSQQRIHANRLNLQYMSHNDAKSHEEMKEYGQKLREKADEILSKLENIPEKIIRIKNKIAYCDSMIAKCEENPQMEEVD